MCVHILVVEDDHRVARGLTTALTRAGFTVSRVMNAHDALAAPPADIVLLDLGLPDGDGLQVCRQLRRRHNCGVIMLTARGEPRDRVLGLRTGADDYVVKPFDPRELLARVRSVLRRTSFSARADLGAERVRMGRCVLDLAAHRLTDETGSEVPMTPLEFDLLKAFAAHPNRPLSRDRILNLGQRRDVDPFDRSVDLRIMRLRKKIEPDPEHPQFIRTVRNEGYLFMPAGGDSA